MLDSIKSGKIVKHFGRKVPPKFIRDLRRHFTRKIPRIYFIYRIFFLDELYRHFQATNLCMVAGILDFNKFYYTICRDDNGKLTYPNAKHVKSFLKENIKDEDKENIYIVMDMPSIHTYMFKILD